MNLLEGKIRNRKNSEEAAHYKSLVVLEGYHWRFHPVARHIKVDMKVDYSNGIQL